MSDWWDFVSRYMRQREMTRDQVAERGGFNKSRMTEWSRGASVTPKLARDTALAMNAPVLDAFVAAGYLEPEDAQAEIIERPASSLSDEELINAVTDRVKELRNALEIAQKPATSPEGDKAKEALRPKNLKDRGGRSLGFGQPTEDTTVDGTEDGEQGHDVPGA